MDDILQEKLSDIVIRHKTPRTKDYKNPIEGYEFLVNYVRKKYPKLKMEQIAKGFGASYSDLRRVITGEVNQFTPKSYHDSFWSIWRLRYAKEQFKLSWIEIGAAIENRYDLENCKNFLARESFRTSSSPFDRPKKPYRLRKKKPAKVRLGKKLMGAEQEMLDRRKKQREVIAEIQPLISTDKTDLTEKKIDKDEYFDYYDLV